MKRQLWRIPTVIWGILLAALLLRLGLAVSIVGHPTDMTTFRAWANYVAEKGFGQFYSGEIFADYPPGYIWVLYGIGKLKIWFDLDFFGKPFILLVKLPSIVTDLLAALLIYKGAVKQWGVKAAAGLTAAYAFNPAILVNSAVWGQVDSVFALVVALFVLLAVRGKLPLAAIVFTIAVLIKPQGLIFTPVFLFALYKHFSWKTFLWSAVGSLAAFLLMILPFGTSRGLFWIVDLYRETLSSYPYASLNAFNLFALLGGNWQPVTSRFIFTYETWGMLFIVLTVGYSTYLYIKNRKQPAFLLFISVVILVLVFVLTAKMHERYMYPALLLSLLSYLQLKDKRLLYLYIGLSLTQFVNVAYVLSFNVHEEYHLYRYNRLLLLTSAANVLLVIYMIVIARGIGKETVPAMLTKNTPGVQAAQSQELLVQQPPEKRLKRKDWLIMAALVLLYAIPAFFRLGDTDAPQTYWKPVTGDYAILDLGQTAAIQKINMYNGIGGGKFSIETSSDGMQWEKVTVPDTIFGSVFTWNSIIEEHQGRYIKVTAESPDARLMEMGVFVKGSAAPAALKLSSVSKTGSSSPGEASSISPLSSEARLDEHAVEEQLIDEQDTVPFQQTYMNSMYFDEIYHGRTAYEHIHLMEPYETTHPPLGKDIMTLGIFGFGMTPFGWRVVGAFVGILMIPPMYLFAFRLFQRTRYAAFAALLLVFDFMHYAQTRIGTVDVYTVFFVILMFYFMYRYSRIDVFAGKLSKSLVPLFLSSLFFGLGISCKWNAVYGGLGLAVLLAYYLVLRHLEYRNAKRMLGEGAGAGAAEAAVVADSEGNPVEAPKPSREAEERWARVVRLYNRYTIGTVLWAALFFVIMPVLIYGLSYIPFLMVPGPGHDWMDVVRFQKFMYDYHSKLVATHPFSSKWWAWMPMVKPVWYFSGPPLEGGKVSSIVAMGNPALWWAGIGALLFAIYRLIRHRAMVMLVPVVAFFSLYIPWMLVPRLTFLYHFFPMMPFVILFVVYALKALEERYPFGRRISVGYLVLAGFLFLMFYPVLSGMVVDRWYVNTFLRWFPSWIF